MTTHSHAILNIALLSKRDKPFLHRYAFIGAVLPDLPLFIFFIVESVIRKTPQRELWGSVYFTEAWQNFFDIFNSIPLILILLGIGVLPTELREDNCLRMESVNPLCFRLPDTPRRRTPPFLPTFRFCF